MQENICSSLQFSQRTDALASALGCRLVDLAGKIGISERSLFGYRKGDYPVTAKALRKLQSAEWDAGVRALPPNVLEDNGDALVREEPSEAGAEKELSILERMKKMEGERAVIIAELASAHKKLDALMDILGRKVEE